PARGTARGTAARFLLPDWSPRRTTGDHGGHVKRFAMAMIGLALTVSGCGATKPAAAPTGSPTSSAAPSATTAMSAKFLADTALITNLDGLGAGWAMSYNSERTPAPITACGGPVNPASDYQLQVEFQGPVGGAGEVVDVFATGQAAELANKIIQ